MLNYCCFTSSFFLASPHFFASSHFFAFPHIFCIPSFFCILSYYFFASPHIFTSPHHSPSLCLCHVHFFASPHFFASSHFFCIPSYFLHPLIFLHSLILFCIPSYFYITSSFSQSLSAACAYVPAGLAPVKLQRDSKTCCCCFFKPVGCDNTSSLAFLLCPGQQAGDPVFWHLRSILWNRNIHLNIALEMSACTFHLVPFLHQVCKYQVRTCWAAQSPSFTSALTPTVS